ncbi:unnamed protein product [Calypogeia fissa]
MPAIALYSRGAAGSSADCLRACNWDRTQKGIMQLGSSCNYHNRDHRRSSESVIIRAGLVEEIIRISKAGGSMVLNGASIGAEPIRMISGRLPFFPSFSPAGSKFGLTFKDINADRVAMEEPVMWDSFRQGRLIERGHLYRQTFVLRSYEVGQDKTASIETIMNYFQETSLGHVMLAGIAGDGFGTTKAMVQNGLIWVVSRVHVEVDRYPVWGEVVELDTWVASSGKNGLRRDWLLRDVKTGQVLARATSTWVMIHQQTRKLSKMPDAAREEMSPHFLERHAFESETCLKISKLQDDSAVYKTSRLQARRTDLDMNHHVNNVKYIDWMTESVPAQCLETQEIRCLTLEYRRECGQTDLVDSLTSPEQVQTSETSVADPEFPYLSGSNDSITLKRNLKPEQQFIHLLKMQADGAEIVRGRTIWRPKSPNRSHPLETLNGRTPTQSELFPTKTAHYTRDTSRKIFPSI